MHPLQITRAGIAGTLAALLVAAVCVRLGIWQLDRLEQRRARNAAVAERMAAPPLRLPPRIADTTGLVFRVIEAEGEFDDARTIVLRNRTLRGAPGVYMLTPLRTPGGTAVLVNRGWVPAPDASTVDPGAFPAPPTARVRGLAIPLDAKERPPDDSDPAVAVAQPDAFRRVWSRLEGAELANQLPYPIHTVYIQELPAADAPEGLPSPFRLPPPELGEGPHLAYALQWFSFAAIAVLGCIVVVARRSAGRGHTGRPTPHLPDRDTR